MALSDVIEEAKFTLNKPRPWMPSSNRAGSPEHHRAMNMDAMDRGIVHRASRRAPWPEHINSPADEAMHRQTKVSCSHSYALPSYLLLCKVIPVLPAQVLVSD
jgi:hypothetical protein